MLLAEDEGCRKLIVSEPLHFMELDMILTLWEDQTLARV